MPVRPPPLPPPPPPPEGAAEPGLAELLHVRVKRLLVQLAGSHIEGLYPVVMREVERALLQTVLEHTAGRREEAAGILGLHRNSLRRRLRATGLEAPPRKRRRPRRRSRS